MRDDEYAPLQTSPAVHDEPAPASRAPRAWPVGMVSGAVGAALVEAARVVLGF